MKLIEKIIKSKYTPYIVIILLSTIAMIPLFTMNLSEYNEARIHISRIIEIKELIPQNIFANLISPKHMLGFGYALGIFYGPITTYIPILISYITASSILSLKIFTLLTVILSGFTMYNFILEISKSKKIALISALIYILAPYKLTDIYSRNAVGEYTAFIFIPLVLHGIYKLLGAKESNEKQSLKKANILIILGATGLILSHTITTIYVAIFSVIYVLINYKKLNLKIIKSAILDIVVIVLLTAFYLVPLLEHKAYGNYTIYDKERMSATGTEVYSTTIGIKDYFASEFGNQEIVFSFGIVITFCLLLTPFAIKKAKNKKEYVTFGLLALLAIYLQSKLFPWQIMPDFLTIIQFAWRLNGLFIFFISYICAVNISVISEMIKDKKDILSLAIVLAVLVCSWFGGARYLSEYDANIDNKFEQNLINAEKIGPYNINREYLPLKACENIFYIQLREDKTYVLEGVAIIENETKNGLTDAMTVSTLEKATLELPYIYYHGYTVKLNGEKLKPYESQNGFLCVDIKSSGKLEVEYEGTTIEKIGYAVSIITLGLFTAYAIIKPRINKAKQKNLKGDNFETK